MVSVHFFLLLLIFKATLTFNFEYYLTYRFRILMVEQEKVTVFESSNYFNSTLDLLIKLCLFYVYFLKK